MAVLFVLAIALIFYILLMRAQSLARMEEQRIQNQNNPQSQVEQLVTARQPLVLIPAATGEGEPTYAYLRFSDEM